MQEVKTIMLVHGLRLGLFLLIFILRADVAFSENKELKITPQSSTLMESSTSTNTIGVLTDDARYLTTRFDPDESLHGGSNGLQKLVLWDAKSGKIIRSVIGESFIISPDASCVLYEKIDSDSEGNVIALLWDRDGKTKRVPNNYTIQNAILSPGCHLVLFRNDDGTIRVWEPEVGKFGKTFIINGKPIGFSGQENFIAGSERGYEIRNALDGRIVREFADEGFEVQQFTFSADNKFIAVRGGKNILKVWNQETGNLIQTFSVNPESYIEPNDARRIALSFDGSLLIETGYVDGVATATVWNVTSKSIISQFKMTNEANIVGVGFSGDYPVAITYAPSVFSLWRLQDHKLMRKFKGSTSAPNSLNFTADGRDILVANEDGKALLFNVMSGVGKKLFLGSSSGFVDAQFSSDNAIVISANHDGRLILWDFYSSNIIKEIDTKGAPSSVAYCDGRVVANVDEQISIWNRDGKQVSPKIEDVISFSSAARAFLTLGDNAGGNKLGYWDLCTNKRLGSFTTSLRSSRVLSADVSADRTRVAIGYTSGGIDVIRLADGRVVWPIPESHHRGVTSLRFVSGGRYLLSGSRDSTAKLWDLKDQKLVQKFSNLDVVLSVGITPDSRYVVSGSADGLTRLWDSKTGKELLIISTSSGGEWLTMLPAVSGGFFNASSVETSMLAVVRGLEATGIDQVYQSLFNPDLVRMALSGDTNDREELEKAAEDLSLEKVLDSGKPPLVSLVAPVEVASVGTDVLKAEGTISDVGGGIGRIEWRVNGLTVGVEYPPSGVGKTYSVSRTLPLDEGKNGIELVAYNAKNLMASLAAKTTVTSTAASKGKPGRLHVIAFGLNDYESTGTGLPNLHYALPDALAIGKALKEAGKGRYAGVTVTGVLDPGITPPKDMDRVFEATSSGLEKAFAAVAKDAEVQDTFVFFAAGHGTAVQGRFHLLGQDYHREGDTDSSIKSRGIGQEKLQAWIANIKAKRGLILLDSCESGAAVTGASRNDADAALGKLHEATGRLVITAANVSQAALEGYHDHGVFTSAILDALVHGDANNNGTIEVSEIADWVQTKVPELSKELREKGSRGIALGYAAQGYAERMAIPAKSDQLAPQDKVSAQKPRTGPRGEDFPLVNKLDGLAQSP